MREFRGPATSARRSLHCGRHHACQSPIITAHRRPLMHYAACAGIAGTRTARIFMQSRGHSLSGWRKVRETSWTRDVVQPSRVEATVRIGYAHWLPVSPGCWEKMHISSSSEATASSSAQLYMLVRYLRYVGTDHRISLTARPTFSRSHRDIRRSRMSAGWSLGGEQK